AGYKGEVPFADPMCGSGTIVCEAALIATNRAPCLYRRFGFQRWPNFSAERWAQIQRASVEKEQATFHPII
ncbi:MAG: class I SAM-dependent RNA methyltransferase, partial [Bacteroidota bacterium]